MQEKNKTKDQFIPFYPDLAIKHNLTPVEGLILGYIKFFNRNGGEFYMSNPELAKRLNCTLIKVKRAIASLQAKNLIQISTKKELGNKRLICDPSAHSEPTPRLIVSLPSAHSEPSPPLSFADKQAHKGRFLRAEKKREKKRIEEEIKKNNKKKEIPSNLIFLKIKLQKTCKFLSFNPSENDLILIQKFLSQEIWFKIVGKEFHDQNELINFLTKTNNE